MSIEVDLTHGALVSAKLDARLPISYTGGRLPVGRFTPVEFAELLARMHRGVTFEDGVVTVPRPGPPGRGSS